MCCVSDNILGFGYYFVVEFIDLLSVGGDALLDIPCMVFQRVCVVPVIPVFI